MGRTKTPFLKADGNLHGCGSGNIRDMMVGVVSGGTGTAAAINGVTVAGKTGTAENATGYDHSWFIGFAPAEIRRLRLRL